MAASYENLPKAERSHVGVDVPNVRDIVAHLGPLDATLPPTPIHDLLAASGATLFVLATDATLIATIRRAAEHYPLFVVQTWAELVEAVQSCRCGIAVLDAAVFGARVPQRLAALDMYSDRLVTLVAADRGAAQDYFGFLSDGRIHRLLIKPLAVEATRLLIESATSRRLELREESANDAHSPSVVVSSRSLEWRRLAAAGAGVVAFLAVAIVGSQLEWWARSGTTEPVAAPTAIAAPATATVPTLEDRLADHRARAALARKEGRLAEPVGDNALDHYLAILAVSPEDPDARGGVASVVETLVTRAEEALLADSLQAAAAALDHFRRADPASSRLAFLDAQLARSLATLAAPPANTAPASTVVAPASTVAVPTELDSVLRLATARLRRGQLLLPAGDSASAYLDRAAELDRDDPRVAVLRNDLAEALIASARLVFDSDIEAAENLAAEARRLGVVSAALVALEADVGSVLAREQQQLSERIEWVAAALIAAGVLLLVVGRQSVKATALKSQSAQRLA
jgi:tetratricopeptide (TPR) repeat protein